VSNAQRLGSQPRQPPSEPHTDETQCNAAFGPLLPRNQPVEQQAAFLGWGGGCSSVMPPEGTGGGADLGSLS
jgi:hypothetical protein